MARPKTDVKAKIISISLSAKRMEVLLRIGITPAKAMRKSLVHISKDELKLKRCVIGEISQAEYDILIDFAYWRGSGGACRSDVVANINKGNYVAACESYLNLDSRKAAGRDCKILSNNCRGVWLRAQERHRKCMESQ